MTREILPNRRMAENITFRVGKIVYTAVLGYYPDGRLAEVFLNSSKIGTESDVIARDSAIATSFALQNGVSVESLRSALTHDAQGNPEGPLGVLFDLITAGEGA